jgi:hypothetical protein
MHYDKVHTHVISSIVHIAHEYDNDDEPWPIQIEDHDGVLHDYNLEAGQVGATLQLQLYPYTYIHYTQMITFTTVYGLSCVFVSIWS